MNPTISKIKEIKRPKILMNCAKAMVKEKHTKPAKRMNNGELEALVSKEYLYEEARVNASSFYSSEEHIELLANMIEQVMLTSQIMKKGLIN